MFVIKICSVDETGPAVSLKHRLKMSDNANKANAEEKTLTFFINNGFCMAKLSNLFQKENEPGYQLNEQYKDLVLIL